ncbi:MAG: chemotaxis protein CheA, partial [Phycisphaeraceae bacterium]|nr:chemotaxis protein CheA [Phycisphaeraceae bacterium]
SGSAEAPIDDDLLSAWVVGCEGLLAELEGRLLALEQSPADGDAIGAIRRAVHTLKGECGVLSLHEVQRLCHEAESLIDGAVEHGHCVPIDPLLALVDWLKGYISRLATDHNAAPTDHDRLRSLLTGGGEISRVEPESEPEAALGSSNHLESGPLTFAPQPGTEENLQDFLCEAREHITASEEALLALEHDNGNIELINTVFRAFHTIKGVSGYMGLGPIVSLAHGAEQLLDGARSGTLSLGRDELDLILASCDMMTRLIGVLEGSAAPPSSEFDSIVRCLASAARGESCAEGRPAPRHETGGRGQEVSPAALAEAKPSQVMSASIARRADQTVKVSTSRMDNLVTMVGELVIAQQMVVQDALRLESTDQRLQRTLSHMGKIIRDLQEVSMSLRMVNLKGTFQKMTRLVRDVSQKAGKQIVCETEGEDVELDRNVVEEITDPLVHMIRNACDHGVEPADVRVAAGKGPTGRVTLRAYHSGGAIVIEIEDDGRGLDRARLLAKAKAKGLVPVDADDASMSDSEVFSLIFQPGFSTAEQVTDISGRGVGMDVVRRNIEALRGKIEIRSILGQGTTFLMRLPLTMAIIDGMVVRVGSQRYVLPTLAIEHSFRPQVGDVYTFAGRGEMVKVRDSMLPIYRLNRVLSLDEGEQEFLRGLFVVLESNDSRCCLLVDEIIGQQQVVIKTLGLGGTSLRGVSGGAILGDGRVALILDVAGIVAEAIRATDVQAAVRALEPEEALA